MLACIFMNSEDKAIFRRATTECQVQKELLDLKIKEMTEKLEILKGRRGQNTVHEPSNDDDQERNIQEHHIQENGSFEKVPEIMVKHVPNDKTGILQKISPKTVTVNHTTVTVNHTSSIPSKFVKSQVAKKVVQHSSTANKHASFENFKSNSTTQIQDSKNTVDPTNHELFLNSGFKDFPVHNLPEMDQSEHNLFEKVQSFIDSGFKKLDLLTIPEVRDILDQANIFGKHELQEKVVEIPSAPPSPVYEWPEVTEESWKHRDEDVKTPGFPKINLEQPSESKTRRILEPKLDSSPSKPHELKIESSETMKSPEIPFLSNLYTKILPPNGKLSLSTSQNCPFELNSNYADSNTLKKIKPLLNSIRRDHFLLNLSPFGPNNQLRGFRDTLILAIYLNRTIVLPPFFKHRTDGSVLLNGYNYQEPQQKLDAVEIAKLVPVVTLDQFSKVCGGVDNSQVSTYKGRIDETAGIDELFLARRDSITDEIKSGKFETFERITKLKVINPMMNGVLGKTTVNEYFYKHEKNAKKRNPQVYVEMTSTNVQKAYGNGTDSVDGKCAIWMQPYRNMLFSNHLLGWVYKFGIHIDIENSLTNFDTGNSNGDRNPNDLLSMQGELSARMMQATCRAKSVRTAAKEFLKMVFGIDDIKQSITFSNANFSDNFVSLHWRYSAFL